MPTELQIEMNIKTNIRRIKEMNRNKWILNERKINN